MARPESGRNGANGRGQGPTSGHNLAVAMEQHVLVVAYNDSIVRANEFMYNQLLAGVDAIGGQLDFTEQDFLKYNITATKVRTEFVNPRWYDQGFRSTGMSVRDTWAIVTPMHTFISAIGIVPIGASGLQIIPVWSTDADEYVLNRDQRDFLTPRIKKAADTCGYKTHDALSTDRDGHSKVMILTYIPTLEEWWTTEPVGVEDGTAALLMGLKPIQNVARGPQGADYEIVDMDQLAVDLQVMPAWVPPLTLGLRTVVRFLFEQVRLDK